MSDVQKCLISSFNSNTSNNLAFVLNDKSEFDSTQFDQEMDKIPDILVQLLNPYNKKKSKIKSIIYC